MRQGIKLEELKPLVDKGLRNREVMKTLNRTKGSIRAAMLKYGLKFKRYTKEERLADYKEKAKIYYNNNPEIFKRARAKTRKKVTDFLRDYKLTHPCVFCGESNPVCIDLHHIDPLTKKYEIGDLARGSGSLDVMKIEIKKCISLCSNCHRKFHFDSNDQGKEIIDYVTQNFSPSFQD